MAGPVDAVTLVARLFHRARLGFGASRELVECWSSSMASVLQLSHRPHLFSRPYRPLNSFRRTAKAMVLALYA